jgi:CPA2 family monovalent cation:H+ antiporter-2
MEHGIQFIQDIGIILIAAVVVGWACQRIGLSVIVGFLVAGMVVGPHSPLVALVHDAERIDTLAQVGLVFLMFSIGLHLSLRRLRRLGLSLLVATFAGALVVYLFSRVLAGSMGWNATEGFVLAAMLMVSSSAIISKVLHETGANHERAGQLAMGVAVLEDVVAVVLLTILTSMAQLEKSGGTSVVETLLLLGAFVVMAGVVGLLIVPWLLKRMSVVADEELQTLGIAGLLFGIAVVAQVAGYSLALGAFLLGTIVAETPHRHQVERTFEGMRDVFSAVFFVAIGMQIDVGQLWQERVLIVGIALFVMVARPLAVTTGLALIGTPVREGLRTGLTMTPIGEFSFIIAQMAVAAQLVPARFYPLAVGVSLLTTLGAPFLTRRADKLAEAVADRQPKRVEAWLGAYRRWLERLQAMQARNVLWQMSRKRLLHVLVGVLFVTGVVIFSEQIFSIVAGWIGPGKLPPMALQIGPWVAMALVIVAPLFAIWRNAETLAMLCAEVSTSGHPDEARRRPLVETALKIGVGALMVLWLAAILPLEGTAPRLLIVSGVVAVAALLVLQRKLVRWHHDLEVELLSVIEAGETKMTATTAPWLQPHQEWNLHMIDCTLPDLADCQGRRILDLNLRTQFGCSVVGVERQGFMISLPPPDTVLYPRDKVLLMGTTEQVKAGKKFLGAVSVTKSDSVFAEVQMAAVAVPVGSRASGRALIELSPAQTHGAQVAGINRHGLRILNPKAQEVLRAGDEILILGTPVQISRFKVWLRELPEEEGGAALRKA